MLALAYFLIVLVALSVIGILLACAIAVRFARRTEPSEPTRWPKVSILRPVKGLDPAARQGFVSFIEQDYPGELETIFAVEGQDDPILPLIRELQGAYPDKIIRLVDSSPRTVEMGKANNVIAASRVASGEVFVSADSDVIAGSRDLRRLVSALMSQGRTGKTVAVAGAMPVYRDMRDLGAMMIGSYYSPFIVLFYALKDAIGPRDVFPGTYYAARPEALERVGGFARVADNIADDSTMGRYLYEAGYECVITNVIGSVPEPSKSLADFWAHQHRWNLTYRTTIPLWQYLVLPVAHFFPLTLLLPFILPAAGLSAALGWTLVGLYVLSRYATVMVLNAVVLKEPAMWRALWLLPVTEIVLLGAWVRALLQTTTSWRGVNYRVSKGGKLVRLK